MEYNKSLSARIRRRNAQGFNGLGNHCRVDDPIKMGVYKDDNESKINHIANQAYALGQVGKHKGSKPIKRLKNAIGQFDSKHYWENKAKDAKK